MKMQKFACALFSLVFLFSCSDESLPSDGELPLNMQKISNRIVMEEAINYVEEARVFLDEQSPSKSRSSRAVNSVSALLFGDVKASMMKSGKYKDIGVSDTLAYVFNFGDSSGFVIVSNDKRVETPLFAFAEKGTLINGKTDNPGLALFLKRLEGYVLESIAKSGKDEEKKEVMAVAQRGPLYPIGARLVASRLVPVEWGQKEPFNDKLEYRGCPNTSNGRVLAGCVATAVAHIMSYWKHPKAIGSTSYNWTLLNSYTHWDDFPSSGSAREMVADLFERIGESVDMNYDCYGSGAQTWKGVEFLVKPSIGFTLYGNTYLRPYDILFVHMALQDYGPLIARGSNADGGHAWVIDALLSMYVPLAPNPYTSYYVHNNWGWNGSQNGYYFAGVYDPPPGYTPPDYIFDPYDSDYEGVELGLVYR
jgi:hypothetical protein